MRSGLSLSITAKSTTPRRGVVEAKPSSRRRRPSSIGHLQALRLQLTNRLVARLLLPLQKFLRDAYRYQRGGSFTQYGYISNQIFLFIHSSCSLIS